MFQAGRLTLSLIWLRTIFVWAEAGENLASKSCKAPGDEFFYGHVRDMRIALFRAVKPVTFPECTAGSSLLLTSREGSS